MMIKSFEILSDCLESCGNDSVCSGVEFDFSDQNCTRTICDPLHQADGTKCEAHSNIKVIFFHTTAYTCGMGGCSEESPSGGVTNPDCNQSGMWFRKWNFNQSITLLSTPTLSLGERWKLSSGGLWQSPSYIQGILVHIRSKMKKGSYIHQFRSATSTEVWHTNLAWTATFL